MKKQYTQPELYVENVVVENGIAASYGVTSIDNWTEDDDTLAF